MCVEYNTVSNFVYLSPPLPPPSSINLHHLNLKSEADLRKTYETWLVPFMVANELAAAGFYFTNWSDMVRCAFCIEMGHWDGGYYALKEYQRWSPFCGFAKGLCVGNIPILSNSQPEKSPQQPTRSRNVCSPHFELRPNSRPERSKYYNFYFFFCKVCLCYNLALIFNVLL